MDCEWRNSTLLGRLSRWLEGSFCRKMLFKGMTKYRIVVVKLKVRCMETQLSPGGTWGLIYMCFTLLSQAAEKFRVSAVENRRASMTKNENVSLCHGSACEFLSVLQRLYRVPCCYWHFCSPFCFHDFPVWAHPAHVVCMCHMGSGTPVGAVMELSPNHHPKRVGETWWRAIRLNWSVWNNSDVQSCMEIFSESPHERWFITHRSQILTSQGPSQLCLMFFSINDSVLTEAISRAACM